MFQGEEDEVIEINPDDVSAEDELLYSHFAGPRVFILNDAEKFNMLGILLEESDDSFLVGLPAKIVRDEDNGFKIEPFMPVPYSRFLKSAILSVSYTFGAIEERFQEYVESKGAEIYPEIMDYIGEDELLEEEQAAPSVSAPTDVVEVSLTKDAQDGSQVIGMTDEELRKYLQDKYNNGELAIGSRKKQ